MEWIEPGLTKFTIHFPMQYRCVMTIFVFLVGSIRLIILFIPFYSRVCCMWNFHVLRQSSLYHPHYTPDSLPMFRFLMLYLSGLFSDPKCFVAISLTHFFCFVTCATYFSMIVFSSLTLVKWLLVLINHTWTALPP